MLARLLLRGFLELSSVNPCVDPPNGRGIFLAARFAPGSGPWPGLGRPFEVWIKKMRLSDYWHLVPESRVSGISKSLNALCLIVVASDQCNSLPPYARRANSVTWRTEAGIFLR